MSERPILVATDLTVRSDRALDRGVQLASQMGAPLVVAHAVEHETPAAQALVGRARESLDREVRELGFAAGGMLLTGSPPEQVADAAERIKARLIVMGAPRYNELRDRLTGTALDALLRRVNVPVLVVKRRARAPYRRLVAATDFSEASRAALFVAAELFADAEITLLHTYSRPVPVRLKADEMTAYGRERAREGMDEFLAGLGGRELSLNVRIEEGPTAPTVETVAEQLDADLIVLGAHGASGYVHATIGSQASEIINWSNRDLLVVRRRAEGPR